MVQYYVELLGEFTKLVGKAGGKWGDVAHFVATKVTRIVQSPPIILYRGNPNTAKVLRNYSGLTQHHRFL